MKRLTTEVKVEGTANAPSQRNKTIKKQNEYEIESNGKLEYVVVQCTRGHRLREVKTGEMKVRQELACPECKARWTVLAPLTNGMEAVP